MINIIHKKHDSFINPRTEFDDCFDYFIEKALDAYCNSLCTDEQQCSCNNRCESFCKFKDEISNKED